MTDLTMTAPVPTGITVTAAAGGDDATPQITGVAVPLGVPSAASQDGNRYLFAGLPANPDALLDVVREHDEDRLLGRLSQPLQHDPETNVLTAQARLYDTTAGRDALTEAREGARLAFSIGATIRRYTERDDGVRVVAAGDWRARHLGFVRRPAFQEATASLVHASLDPTTQENPMPVTATTETTPADLASAAPTTQELPTVAELAEAVAQRLEEREGAARDPLAAFSSFTDYMAAFQAAPEDRQQELAATFAVPDQVLADNPGLQRLGWRNEIKMRIDARRPAIQAFGGPIGLPVDGMQAAWPYFDGSIDDVIKQQMAEKTELSGVKLSIKQATEPIKTAGTVSDISYQLLMRGTPSYLAAYMTLCLAAWARYTERQFETALLQRGTYAGALDVSSAAKAKAWLFSASTDVDDATGAPASVVLVDRETFVSLGSLDGLTPASYGTQNVAGTAQASTLRVEVSGLQVVRAPWLPAKTAILGNPDAARFAETGPMVASAEDVRKLGRDVAVWGMYEDAEVYFPAGIRVYSPTKPAA